MEGEKMKEKVILESYADLDEEQKASIPDIRHYAVLNSTGEEIGSITDLFLDPRHRHMAMVLIKLGGLMGIGSRLILVPWDQIEILEEMQIRVKTKDVVETEVFTGVAP